MAKLFLRYGAMNCGKTTALLQIAHNYEERDGRIIILKPDVDKKGGDNIVSRLNIERKVDYLIKSNDSIIEQIKDELPTLSCILTDESQFFTEEHIFELFILAHHYNIPVISFSLRADFKTNSFPGSKRLFELADEMDELITICRCGKKAKFNGRKYKGQFVSEGDQVAIDEQKNITYESLCPSCYLEKVLHYEQPKVLKKM